MMRHANIQMTTTVPKEKLLETLRANRAKHKEVVQEAREGYVRKAMDALRKKLEEVEAAAKAGRAGTLTVSVTLSPPQDYTEVYDNAISMLEWNTEDEIELEADEFRQLVRDEWDWSGGFLQQNSLYSKKAWDWANESLVGSLVSCPRPD